MPTKAAAPFSSRDVIPRSEARLGNAATSSVIGIPGAGEGRGQCGLRELCVHVADTAVLDEGSGEGRAREAIDTEGVSAGAEGVLRQFPRYLLELDVRKDGCGSSHFICWCFRLYLVCARAF